MTASRLANCAENACNKYARQGIGKPLSGGAASESRHRACEERDSVSEPSPYDRDEVRTPVRVEGARGEPAVGVERLDVGRDLLATGCATKSRAKREDWRNAPVPPNPRNRVHRCKNHRPGVGRWKRSSPDREPSVPAVGVERDATEGTTARNAERGRGARVGRW